MHKSIYLDCYLILDRFIQRTEKRSILLKIWLGNFAPPTKILIRIWTNCSQPVTWYPFMKITYLGPFAEERCRLLVLIPTGLEISTNYKRIKLHTKAECGKADLPDLVHTSNQSKCKRQFLHFIYKDFEYTPYNIKWYNT